MAYCTYEDVYRECGLDIESGITVANINAFIADAEAEINELFGMNFNSGNSLTEWFDTYDEPNVTIPGKSINAVYLSKIPIISIISVEEYNLNGTVVKVWNEDEYWLDKDIGEIRIITGEFAPQRHRVKVVYEWGYTTVPRWVQNLCSVIAGMSALRQKIGTTYDDVTSYSLPGVSMAVGEPYVNMLRDLEKLKEKRQNILDAVGRLKENVVII